MTSLRAPAAILTCLISTTAVFAAPPSADPGNDPAVIDVFNAGDEVEIRVDGRLDDAAWSRAVPLTGFRQRDPQEGADASVQTEVRVVFDATALYVGVRAIDSDAGKIVGLLTRRDTRSPSDWIRVAIDSFHDRRTAYEFAVNPAGVKQDKYYFNDGDEDDGWDAVWDVSAVTTADGWQAEFRIPFSQLRFSPTHDGRIGFAVFRHVPHLNEVSSWPLVAKSRTGFVSQFGSLANVTPGRAPRRLELQPYMVSELTTNPSAHVNTFVPRRDPSAALGLDMKYALSPGLTLTATVNPDFGQVEADPAVVNLSAFETFFPERRPFFLEGSGTLRFDLDCNDGECTGLFYSRRIGRSPQGYIDSPDATVSSPAQSTILGATKITGRIGAFSVGAMNALTQRESASFLVGDRRGSQTVEPFTSYSVARASREFTNQSQIGFMFTATNRDLDAPMRPLVASSAYTGGIDFDWRLSRRYKVEGYLAGSTVQGDAAAIASLQQSNRHSFQRPDATHVELDDTRTSLQGHAGSLAFVKHGGERVRFSSYWGYKSPGFEINDLGFMSRADQISQSNWLQWRFDRPNRFKRNIRVNFNQWSGYNFDGDRLNLGGNINAHIQFANNWRIGSGLNVNADGFDDRLTRGGPGGLRNGRIGNWHYLDSDDRKPVVFNWFGFVGTDRHGSRELEASPRLTFRPTSALTLSPGISYRRNRNEQQWIEALDLDRTHYIFGRIDQTTLGMTMRVNYTMSPRLSLQVYAEPFTSTGRYTNFKELASGRAPYDRRYAAIAYDGNPDFRYTSFRTTNVLRWEYRPGSTLYVVWQQGREQVDERSDYSLGRSVGDIFAAPGRNVFLVKVAHWINR